MHRRATSARLVAFVVAFVVATAVWLLCCRSVLLVVLVLPTEFYIMSRLILLVASTPNPPPPFPLSLPHPFFIRFKARCKLSLPYELECVMRADPARGKQLTPQHLLHAAVSEKCLLPFSIAPKND